MAEYDFGLSGKIAIEQLDDMFRGAGFGQAGEAADVGEEDGDFLALSSLRLRQGIASNQGADDAWINEAAKQLQGVFALASFAEVGFQGAGMACHVVRWAETARSAGKVSLARAARTAG